MKVKVSGVTWRTAFSGMVKPLIQLDKMYGINKTEFDSIALPDAASYGIYSVVPNDVVLVSVKRGGAISIKGVYPSGDTAHTAQMPTKCPTCKGELNSYREKELYCINDFCSSKSRTPVIKVMRNACTEQNLEVETISFFKAINEFPVGSTPERTVSVDNIFELMLALSENRKFWETAAFRDKVDATFSKFIDNGYVNIYKPLMEYLSNTITSEQFWDICSIKGSDVEGIPKELAEMDCYDLCDPVEFSSRVDAIKGISDDYRNTIKTAFTALEKFSKDLILFMSKGVKVEDSLE